MKGLSFIRILQSHCYKIRHSFLIILTILVPLGMTVLFGSYFAMSSWGEASRKKAFLEAYAMAYPFFICLATYILFQIDEKAGQFQGLFTLPNAKVVVHLGNVMVLMVAGLIGSMISFLTFALFDATFCNGTLSLGWTVGTAGILLLANLSVYMLQYMICYGLSSGLSMVMGVIGMMLSCILAYSMGDKIWQLVPWSYGMRIGLSIYYQSADRMLFSSIKENFYRGLLVAILFTIITLLVFCFWGARWEGNLEKENE